MRRAKVADHVDATGRLVGRRIVLSNMSDVERLGANFSTFAERKTECSLFQCVEHTWKSFSDCVRSLVHAHARTGRANRDTKDCAWESCWYQGTNYGASQEPQSLSN